MSRGGSCFVVLAAIVVLGLCLPVAARAEGPSDQGQASARAEARFGAVEAFQAPDQARAAGVQWERVLFWWYMLQPRGPEDWNGEYFKDSLLDRELASGRDVVGCLLNPPFWANGSPLPTDLPKNLYLPYDSPDNYWGQFVKRVVSRYRGRIDRWIIGNEPDVWDAGNAGFTFNGSVADYYQFLKVAYQAAKAANPAATVVTAGLTYWWDQEFGREQYFRRLLAEAKRDPTAPTNNWYFDAVALQLYNDPRSLFDVPRLFQGMMAEAGLPAKPIWVTETNVAPWDDPVDPLPRERFRATLDEQAAYLIQAFSYVMAADVERVAAYKMADIPGLPAGLERYGLVREDGSERPAYRAFQTAASYLAGARGGRVLRDGTTVSIVFDKGAVQVSVVWNATPRALTARIPAASASALLVDQSGMQREIEANAGFFTLSLAPATANTVPDQPDTYRIGGPPFILVERLPEGARAELTLPEEPPRWLDETTGNAVTGDWLVAYKAMGGLDNLGHPRSGVIADPAMGGQTAQYFQRGVLEYHPENDAPYRIQRRLLGDMLYPGSAPPASGDGAPPGPSHYFPFKPGEISGLGHFVADYTVSGAPIYFKEYFDKHGGINAFGYPKEEPALRNGRWTQLFQAALFEYHPEHDRDGLLPATQIPYRNYRVQLALLGDAFMRRSGLLP